MSVIASAISRPMVPLVRLPGRLAVPMLYLGLTLAMAGVVALMGAWSLVLLIYAVGLFLALLYPARAAMAILLVSIVVEPGAIDFTRPLALSLWQMPPGFEQAVPFTTSPIELMILMASAAAFVRYPARTQTPLVAWAVPAALALGFAYGMYKGGPSNLAYNEARGLIIGIAVFVLASRTLPADLAPLAKWVMVAEALSAVVIAARYVLYVRSGNLDVPVEAAFAHEGSVILGIGFIIGAIALIQHAHTWQARMLLGSYCLLIVFAMLATERRSATLVLLVGALSMTILLLPVRPKLVIAGVVLFGSLGAVYLAAYWNAEYGATAQPARAIRSQIDPSARDGSSNNYRLIEKFDVIVTIRDNRVFGVGFGRPFVQVQRLPDLSYFWPLQSYTPHQNILWLWLKMGIFGVSVVLGLAVVVIQRCIVHLRQRHRDIQWSAAAVTLTGTLMFLIYSTVDLGFIGPRSVAPAAILTAVGFSLARLSPGGPDAERDTTSPARPATRRTGR